MCFPLGWGWKVLGPVTHRGTHILLEREVMAGAAGSDGGCAGPVCEELCALR